MVRAQKMKERDLQDQVIQLARLQGWTIHHCRPGRRKDGSWATQIQGDVGFPDLVLARAGEAMFVELKSETGRLTAQQKHWIEVLEDAGETIHVWRPSDFPEIQKVLKR